MESDTRPATATDGPAPAPASSLARLRRSSDLILASVLALMAVLAVGLLPDGSALRIAIVIPILFFVPGYLLLQVLVMREPARRSRLAHVFVAIGLSPALVGLLALSTALVPKGFQPEWIVAVVTVGCLFLAVLADYRRVQFATRHTRSTRRRRPATIAQPSTADSIPATQRQA